ncbi:MAG: helix-turn-helix transcriptional regulator [Betaproteobacteria bacterium]|nr:helix-turn-helix transcriptional regulator [Betaproteobacteria bacterium]MBI2959271.1 helix-turn-helix transcriptional regulator [Betaproteobacteria bacterium]
MTNTPLARQVFQAFARVHILHHAAEGPIFGLEMIKELQRHGYAIGPGTLYPILHSLRKARWLRSAELVVNGKRRKYYVATAGGRRALAEVRKKIRELGREVLGEQTAK